MGLRTRVKSPSQGPIFPKFINLTNYIILFITQLDHQVSVTFRSPADYVSLSDRKGYVLPFWKSEFKTGSFGIYCRNCCEFFEFFIRIRRIIRWLDGGNIFDEVTLRVDCVFEPWFLTSTLEKQSIIFNGSIFMNCGFVEFNVFCCSIMGPMPKVSRLKLLYQSRLANSTALSRVSFILRRWLQWYQCYILLTICKQNFTYDSTIRRRQIHSDIINK